MKTAAVILISLIVCGCAGNKLSKEAGKPTEFVTELPGKTKQHIFQSTRAWISDSFDLSQMVIDELDEQSGKIIARGKTRHPCGKYSYDCANAYVGFVLQIDSDNGKLHTVFKNPTIIRSDAIAQAKTLGDELDSWEAFYLMNTNLIKYVKK